MLATTVINYCEKIGQDFDLVQGAGGNVSWKENGALWVKASGTRLSEAKFQNIFVPIELRALTAEIEHGHFNATPKVLNDSQLKPSIETCLHALMPHKIVVHVHAIPIVATLVKKNASDILANSLNSKLDYALVEYAKPGEHLAKAVYETLKKNPNVNIVFLKNHGVVIGGSSVEEIDLLLRLACDSLSQTLFEYSPNKLPQNIVAPLNSIIPNKKQIQHLAFDASLFQKVKDYWAIYPDHIVFLGPRAITFESLTQFESTKYDVIPELFFIKNVGVFCKEPLNKDKEEQLYCYFKVVSKLEEIDKCDVLSNNEISALTDWDAEKYRLKISKGI
ncbi:class II aldolase [Vibrio fluvialis]|nr:class II aldolase [Vibrio fluvialis]EKO3505130.1 class II aldolase [Vibrio fluvialis]EKO5151420.1 class II aldolase [Vibrio fluvialis]ELC0658922.1 class II aldolase [Vibrio fluvialis]ELL4668379.1 class II aldolase [Vibrio fluvialis]